MPQIGKEEDKISSSELFSRPSLPCLQIYLQNHRSWCPTTFSANMSYIQSMLFPKMIRIIDFMAITQKVTQHCKLSAKKILLISKTCSESSSDFFAPFISEIALKRIVHRLSNIFLSQAISYSIALFWSDNSVMAIKVTGLQNFLIFPCETCKRTNLPLLKWFFKWLNHLNWSQFNRSSFWESEFMKSLVEPIKRLCKLPAGYLYLRNPEIRDWRKW